MSDRGRSPAASGGPAGASRAAQMSMSRDNSSASSQAKDPSKSWSPGMGFDPAKPAAKADKGNTRMELPPDAFVPDTQKSRFALRNNKMNTEGKPIPIEVNQYRMKSFDSSKKIYQYDVLISPDTEKKAVVLKKIWQHPTTKKFLEKYSFPKWIFDGRKLAWAPALLDRGEIRFAVDLDEGKRPPNAPAREGNKFLIMIRKTTTIDVSVLRGYLDNKVSFSTAVQEALNFLDHLLRQWPSQRMLCIKRNFYNEQGSGIALNPAPSYVEVHKGLYASIRLSHNLKNGGIGLALNADVVNTCFWAAPWTVAQMVGPYLHGCDSRRWHGLLPENMSREFRPVKQGDQWGSSDAFKHLRKLRRLRFKVQHPNRANSDTVYSIQDFVFDQGYGSEGATAATVSFDCNGKKMTIRDYYMSRYKAHLMYPNLPVIDAGKGRYFPFEFAYLEPLQRYPFKLNPEQTAAMIKLAVTRPAVRRSDIQKGVDSLQLQQDPFLKEYGVQFEPGFTRTEARLLPPPKVEFGQGSGVVEPKFSGRWDLRGKKFFKQNAAPMASWGFIAMNNCVDYPSLQNFAKSFRQSFLAHGGNCSQEAMLMNVPPNFRDNIAGAMAWAVEEMTRQRGYPQLLFVVVAHRNSPHYERLKKSGDCRFGILTQVVNNDSVRKNHGQYLSNVCLKVNAKLGGATSRTPPPWKSTPHYFPADRPTMIIGVDISHPPPGGTSPSTAAMTMSLDRDATRYGAMVESNGYRKEMLEAVNVHTFMNHLSNLWRSAHGGGAFPRHIIYFRDGVSEGQFAHVLDQEIGQIRAWFDENAKGKPMPKFTVVIATKRHHIRFFPPSNSRDADRNGNPLPGTLVEREVTHPFMWDFYLNSHAAIQGTARPVHYHIILDEMGVPANDFQKMIYHQCYTYARSTTPVSLHPAVYYAHLAGARARCHENVSAGLGYRHGGKGHEVIQERIARGVTMGGPSDDGVPRALLTLGGEVDGEKGAVEGEQRQRNFFRSTMWYM
ncbi:hypothetical protein CDD81_2045 [Ophiocordyceps australis]|uniref:Piwi domain-containing protein n=1 Tax=Ophiocordyceps australis TaxID=1399860 RepID=A0A2C5YDQ3_9HYPO|nr:hypothetical protein CDD81_2045 [Ophiocordyceps australis]